MEEKGPNPFQPKTQSSMGGVGSASGVKKRKHSKKSRGAGKGQRQRKPKLKSSDATKASEMTGDSLQDANVGPGLKELVKSSQSNPEMMLVDGVNDLLAANKTQKKLSKGKRKNILSRQKRRMKSDQQRCVVDSFLRSAPHRVMWEWYKSQAGEHMSLSDRISKQWTPDQICVVEDGSEKSLVPHIRRIVGENYAEATPDVQEKNHKRRPLKDKSTGMACLAIGYDAESATRLAKRVYDGSPVVKLFSRHIGMDEQKKTLQNIPNGFTVTMSGTAKRIHDLINEGLLTLNHTKVVVIDLCRTSLLNNLLDVPTTSGELFSLIHNHMQQLLERGSLNIIVVIQTEDETPKERFASQKPDVDEDRMEDAPDDEGNSGTEN